MLTELKKLAAAVGMGHVEITLHDASDGYGFADKDGHAIHIGRQEDDADYQGVLLHELSHVAGQPPEQRAAPMHTTEQAAEHLASIPAREARPFRKVVPWLWHGAAFNRLCLHLQHRAIVAGYEISWTACRFAGRQYGQSPAWMYAAALGDEPLRLAHLPPWEISTVPAPPEFSQLFADDISQFKETK